jgi:SnoaL-like domain
MSQMRQVTESPGQIALKYFEHWSKKDYEGSAQFLDENLSFKGPIDTFNNSQDYLRAISRLGKILKEVQVKRTFVEGNDACFIYDLVTDTPAGTSPCAEWIHVHNGKVKSIQVFFDARPFATVFERK